jgi:alkanesulfonate monooxygenase SsuD/methylene tetrahydromethanopterin reductase-like flavin-dependent oxidoreductase (luciferase family)
MKVGLFVDARNPPEWARPWASHYETLLRQIADAEALGIDSVWLTEHHFFEDGYLPQPLTLAAAIAARTERIRIGTAVFLVALRRALDVAEQAALVDLISGGRLELGFGAGYRVPEFEAFGAPIERRYNLLEEHASEIKRLWEQGGFTPAPLQQRAPLWIGSHGPRGARIAGRLGAGMLSFAPAVQQPYREALAEAGYGPERARLTGMANLVLSDDPEAAWARIAPHLAYQWSSYARYGAEGRERGGKTSAAAPLADLSSELDPATLRSNGPDMSQPRFDVVTAEDAIERLQAWLGELPVETVYFSMSIAGMPEDLRERHVELLATVLAPAIAELGLRADS